MHSFKDFVRLIEAGGEAAGGLEIVKTPVDRAKEYADKKFGKPVEEVLPGFEQNYQRAQAAARLGHTKRKDMPVIDMSDVKLLQIRLTKGALDLEKPFAKETGGDPFPNGMNRAQAQLFLRNGFRDGDKEDDVTKVEQVRVAASQMKPIQEQIYFDKSMDAIAKSGIEGTRKFLGSSFMVLSEDNYIIDGHHRWLSALLIDASITMPGARIYLPIQKLIKLLGTYGDAIGNKRNQ